MPLPPDPGPAPLHDAPARPHETPAQSYDTRPRLGDAIDLGAVRRALVIKLRHHGDVLLTSPVFAVLKNHAPHVQIDALVYRDTQEMLTLHPAIDQVFGIDRAWKKRGPVHALVQELRLFNALRARGYDLVVHLTENARGAVLAKLLGARFSVAAEYKHKRGRLWRWSFTHLCRQPPNPRHTVELHLDHLRRLGIYPRTDERGLVLVPGDAAEASVRNALVRHGLVGHGFVHLHPTSRWLFKSWDEDKYAQLIDRLQEAGKRVVVTAAPNDAELAITRRILARLHAPAIDLSGQLTLKELAALTARARCFVGVDSVPMHIAAAVQTPTVALFGPSGEINWAPWRVAHQVISDDSFACRPCGIDGCGGGKVSECLSAIGIEPVFDAVMRLCRT